MTRVEPPGLDVRIEAQVSKVSIGDYLKYIDGLLDEERVVEAAAHCRHILESHPRYIETYRLLGKALLEQQKFEDAGDVLQRILSADPEDFIAHVGLAIVNKEAERLSEAVWHMERAFELDPYNAAIQEELRALYIARDGDAPDRIALSQGALARLYGRGDLFQQAAAELRQAVDEDPSRVDLQVLLAEVLWRDDQRVEAMERCLTLLEQLPYCIKANAIVAEVWQAGGRADEARRYYENLMVLTALDQTVIEPESAVGRAFAADGAPRLPADLMLERLVYVAQDSTTEAFSLEDTPDWVQELGELEAAAEEEEATPDDDMLDWLREAAVSDDVSDETAVVDDAETPDWLREASLPLSDEGETAVDAETPAWLEEPEFDEEVNAVVEDESPEWLADLAAGVEGLGSEDALVDDVAADAMLADEFEGQDDEGWLEELTPETLAEATPDWLEEPVESEGDAHKAMAEPFEATAEPPEPVDEPAWLAELDEPEADEGAPDWLAAIEAEAAEEAAQLPAWLRQEVTDESAPTMDSPPDIVTADLDDWLSDEGAVETPDWLAELDDDEESAAPTVDDSSVAGAVAPEAMEMAMMGDVNEPEVEDPSSDDDDLEDALAWLEELAAQEEAPETTSESTDALGDALAAEDIALPTEDIPDWLKADAAASDTMPEWLESDPAAELELPGWLKGLEDEATASAAAGPLEPPDAEEISAADEAALMAELGLDAAADEGLELGGDTVDEAEWLGALAADDVAEATARPGENGEDLSWLDELAAGGGEVFEEPPTLTWEATDDAGVATEEPSPEEEPLVPADLPAWLAEMAPPDADAVKDVPLPAAEELPEEMPEDPEEARRWLDALAASRGTLDMLEGKAEPEAMTGPEMAATDAPPEAAAESDAAELMDVPDDPEAAMAWLEQLAARQGAPVEELPSIDDDSAPAPDLTAAFDEFDSAPAEEAFAFEEPEATEHAADEPVVVDAMEEVELSDAIVEAEAGVTPPVDMEGSLLAEEPEVIGADEVPEDLEDAMAWLERLAAQQGAPLEELPSVDAVEEAPVATGDVPSEEHVVDPAAAGDQVADLQLEETPDLMAEAEAGDTVEEATVSEDTAPLRPLSPVDDETAMELDAPVTAEADVPEDLDDAMAWLESLAAKQGAPIEELPSVTAGEGDVRAGEGPVADDDVLETDAIEADALAAEVDMIAPIEADEPAQLTSFDDIPAELADDPDEMMAWLERMAVEQGAPEADLQLAGAEEESAALENDTKADLSGDELDLMPDDPDEAIAWLEQLAAQDEVPDTSLTPDTTTEAAPAFTVDAGDGIPDWLRAEVADEITTPPAGEDASDAPSAGDEIPVPAAEVETSEALPETAETVDEEAPAAVEVPADESLADIVSEQDVAESLPDWLTLDAEPGEVAAAEWETEEAGTVTGWLAAEEELGLAPPETEPEPRADSIPEVEPAMESEPAKAQEVGPERVSGAEFGAARQALGEGRGADAVAEYKRLLDTGEGLGDLIAELETAVEQNEDQPLLRRVLGDAYMQNGQLQKALDCYRQALEYL